MNRPRRSERELPMVEYAGGVHLAGTPLWFDAPEPTELCFLSSVSAGDVPAHRRILATERTIKLFGGRVRRAAALVCPFRRAFALGDLEIELFPAGHLPGSAQLRVRTERGAVVYAGTVRTEGPGIVERAQVVPCDVLVLDATYGHPRYSFPGRAELEEKLLSFARRCLARGATPVVYAPELGESQEALRLFGEQGIATRVHRVVYEWCRRYREIGIDLPGVRRFQGTPAKDEVVLFPLRLRGSRAIAALKKVRTLALTADAMERGARGRLHVDEVLPWSTHPGFAATRHLVEAARPSRVYTFSTHAKALAEALREAGIDAVPLSPPAQIDLF